MKNQIAATLALTLAAAPLAAQEQPSAYDTMPVGPGTGAHPAVMTQDASLPAHVIYRPADMATSKELGVLVWGNGGCSADGASARQHLIEIASHGYIVIAPGEIMSGPGATRKREPRMADKSGQLPPVATTSADVKAGLDWALTENARKGSALYGRIDTRALAVAGHSCGGLQALELAPDPRIRAVLVHNSGVFTDGTNPIRGISVNKAMLEKLHTPVLYVLGGPEDIAFPNGTDDFKRIAKVPAALVQLPVGHGGTFHSANGGAVAALSVDWLEWQLRGDRTAARSFTGSNCRLCVVPGWTIEKKGID
ncbi:alpha/beta hydrolase [Novosphingobium taihuense]|uniref:hypothetical protein n=1 Tax=Novosphingobium taihuense TaxID=260085 RepID=UPI0011994F60|nr:hypothetical protein [Novosphingobium taihuense]TWH84612.1 hypothetical protein IQ25_02367 [Novosphingobium taihuense]